MSILTNKLFWALLLLVITGGIGYYLGSSQVQTQYVEGEVKVITRVVTVEKIVQPDGTVIERTITDNSTREERTESTTTTPALAQYSLGVQYISSYKDLLDNPQEMRNPDRYVLVGGRRLLGPVWGELLLGTKQLGLGVRYEF